MYVILIIIIFWVFVYTSHSYSFLKSFICYTTYFENWLEKFNQIYWRTDEAIYRRHPVFIYELLVTLTAALLIFHGRSDSRASLASIKYFILTRSIYTYLPTHSYIEFVFVFDPSTAVATCSSRHENYVERVKLTTYIRRCNNCNNNCNIWALTMTTIQ